MKILIHGEYPPIENILITGILMFIVIISLTIGTWLILREKQEIDKHDEKETYRQ